MVARDLDGDGGKIHAELVNCRKKIEQVLNSLA
jgi:hypothetical protein